MQREPRNRQEASLVPPLDRAAGSIRHRDRLSRLRRYLVLGPLLVLLVAWLWIMFQVITTFNRGPNGAGMGTDFAIYFGAARVVHDGGNPYNHVLLYRTESMLLRAQHLPVNPDPGIVLAGNPPLFFYLLSPLTRFPFQVVASIWILGIYVVSILGCMAALRYFGWRRGVVPLLIFLAMPQVILGAYDGNVTGLVFASVAASLMLIRRNPIAGGLLLSVSCVKPQIALPAVALVLLFQAPQRLRVVLGFAVGVVLFGLLTIVTTGATSVVEWLATSLTFSQVTGVEPKLASLVGLYASQSPPPLRLGLEGAVLLVAVLLTAGQWWLSRRRAETPLEQVAWLWFVWILATPFAHFYDEMVLTIPIVAGLGRDGSRVTSAYGAPALYLMFGSLYLLRWYPDGVQLLSVPLLLAGLCLWLAARRSQPAVRAAPSTDAAPPQLEGPIPDRGR